MKIPHDNKSERQIISLILQRPEVIHELSELLPHHFYDSENRSIYTAAVEVQSEGEQVDIVSVENKLSEKFDNDSTIFTTLTDCLNEVTTSSTLEYSKKNIINSYRKRKLQESMLEVQEKLSGDDITSNPNEAIEDIINSISTVINELHAESSGRSKCNIDELVDEYVDYLKQNKERIENSDGSIIGLPTGIDELDIMIDGLQDSGLYVVAAMTSGGKSAHMVNMVSAITNLGKKASVYSLEMTPNGIINRIVGLRTKFDASRIKRLELDSNESVKLSSEIKKLKGQGLKIYDSEFNDIDRIINSIVSDAYRGETDIAFIDYIQMVTHKNSKEERQKLEYAVTALRSMVNKVNIPVVVLTQLNNETVDNPNKESHGFQGSGAIAQRATAAWTLKPDVPKQVRKEMHKHGMALPVKIEFNKNQEGAVSYCLASFLGKTGEFKSVTEKEFIELKESGENLMGGFDFNFDDDE